MSSTTGILSLSVHEAFDLTFEGCEIALHPSLFAVSATAAAAAAAASATAPNSASASVDGDSSALLSTPVSLTKSKAAVAAAASQKGKRTKQSKMGLDVGDMIEIRVWTPKPQQSSSGGSPGSTQQQHGTPAGAMTRHQGNSGSIAGGAFRGMISPTRQGGRFVIRSPCSANTSIKDALSSSPPAQPPTQQQSSAPPSPSGRSNEESRTMASSVSEDSLIMTKVSETDASGGVRQIAMRREGSSAGALAVEPADIKTPVLSELKRAISDGTEGGVDSMAQSSLSSSPHLSLAGAPSGSASGPAPPTTLSSTPGNLPPLPPSRQSLLPPRSRTNTADNVHVSPSKTLPRGVGSSSVQEVQDAPSAVHHGNRIRINTLPTDIAKDIDKTSSGEQSLSPKRSDGIRRLTTVDTTPGHVRDISKLSVGSDFVETPMVAQAVRQHNQQQQHMRDASSFSSGAGDGQGQMQVATSDAAGVSGRIARSLMLNAMHGTSRQQTPGMMIAGKSALAQTGSFDNTLQAIRETHDEREMFVMMVTKKTLTSIKSSARTQVSILKQVADLYHMSQYDRVTVTKVAAEDEKEVLEEVSADFILVTFKDQFISRGEMYQFQHSIIGRWLYEGVRLDSSADGIRANAVEIRHAEEKFCSGIVTENTKITFRSRSTRIIWLLQISSEMFEYAPPVDSGTSGGTSGIDDDGCEIYFDKFVTFMHRLFAKWKELEVTHSLTVVFFSRTFSRQEQEASSGGKGYEDHYKMVIENETTPKWDSLIYKIKKAFVRYPIEVGWHLSAKAGRVPSTASQGNLLEAINITLNLLSLHYADRDLHRTGNSIVVISAGSGVFEVDKGLASITKQRMMDNGIGSDMLSLTLPPLHIAPFFLFDVESTAKEETPEFDDWKGYFEIPHWMHLSFLSYDNDVIPNNTASAAAPGLSMNMISPLVQPPAVSANGGMCFPNGFVVRMPAVEVDTNETPRQPIASGLEAETPTGKSHSQRQQRHLISSRNFEDILEACRPRNRGDTLAAFPSALALLVPNNTGEEDNTQTMSEALNAVSGGRELSSPQIDAYEHKSCDLEPVSEWGAINFEATGGESLVRIAEGSSSISPAGVALMEEYAHVHQDKTRAGSDKSPSPSSSFSSSHNSSMFFGRSVERSPKLLSSSFPLRGEFGFGQDATALQIQPSSDLPLPLLAEARTPDDRHQHLIRFNSALSEDSLSTTASEDRRKGTMQVDKSVDVLKKMMLSYDTSMFVPPTTDNTKGRGGADETTKHDHRHDARDIAGTGWLTQQHSVGALSPLGEQTTSVSGFNSSSRSPNQTPGGGIGAALHHFDGSTVAMMTKRRSMVHLDRAHLTTPFFGGPASFGHHAQTDIANIGPSPSLLESVGMPLGSDPPDMVRPSPSSYARALDHSSQGGRLGPLRTGESTSSSGMPGTAGGRKLSNLTTAEVSPSASYDNRKLQGQDQGDARPRSHSPTKTSQRHHSSHHSSQQNSHHRHHRHGGSKHKGKGRSKSQRNQHAAHSAPAPFSQASRRKAWVLNPFRQEDEDEVLAKKTHNRRRWSHVFPPGEIEFKRHAGPNWRSLSQPAILPTTIDYHPSPQELDDPARFQFNHYSVSLEAMEDTGYKSHKELLQEMVRQRLIQDYQIVPHSIIMQSRTHKSEVERRGAKRGVAAAGPILERGVPVRQGLLSGMRTAAIGSSTIATLPNQRPLPSADDDLQYTHTLSMGHRIQLLSYNHDEETIEVKQYFSRLAMSDQAKHPYQYSLWCPVQRKYVKVRQEFKKYGDEYLWNKVDNTIVCGDGDMRLFEGSRYRRIMFRILPDEDITNDPKKEGDYVKKFQRLLDYIGKQLLDISPDQMDIKIITSADAEKEASKRRMCFDNRHFRVPLKKGSADRNQWMEMLIDSTFDTRASYKIMLNWLVASAVQVGAQVKLLQRRCAQYGLRLISFPQDSVTGGVQLHPFIAPILLHIRDKDAVDQVERSLYSIDFIDDCMIPMETSELEKETNYDYQFPVSRFGRRRLKAPSKQYVHLSGTLFCRIVRDMKGRGIMIVYENRRYVSGNVELTKKARLAFGRLKGLLASCMGKDSVD